MNLLVSMLVLVLLLIFVIDALLPSLMTFPMWMMEPQMISPKRKSTKNLILINGTKTTMAKPTIFCKGCNIRFDRLDWLTNKVCDNPDCNCPEIRKTMRATQVAIHRAAESSKQANKIVVTETVIPTGWEEEEDQYYIPIPGVQVINITPSKR